METLHTPGHRTSIKILRRARLLEVQHRQKVLPETALKLRSKPNSLARFSAAIAKSGINILYRRTEPFPSRRALFANPFDPVALATSFEPPGVSLFPFLPKAKSLSRFAQKSSRRAEKHPAFRYCKFYFPIRGSLGNPRPNDADSFLRSSPCLRQQQLIEISIALGQELAWKRDGRSSTSEELTRAIDAGAKNYRRQQPQPENVENA